MRAKSASAHAVSPGRRQILPKSARNREIPYINLWSNLVWLPRWAMLGGQLRLAVSVIVFGQSMIRFAVVGIDLEHILEPGDPLWQFTTAQKNLTNFTATIQVIRVCL